MAVSHIRSSPSLLTPSSVVRCARREATWRLTDGREKGDDRMTEHQSASKALEPLAKRTIAVK
jgi:hypothetical protein